MPNIEAQVAIIGGERFITACDVKDIDLFKVSPFGRRKARWVF